MEEYKMGKIVFGVDIGGTTVKLGMFDEQGTVLDKWEIPTRTEEQGSFILGDVAKSIEAKISGGGYAKEDVLGIGVGAPGPVDEAGNIGGAVNLGWGNLNIVDALEPLAGVPVKAGNDANVAALGEMWKGGGKGCQDMVAVTLGTGVGGGIIVNGMLVSGFNGSGGEIGHMQVEEEETGSCNCGLKGCLEQYASATGVVRLAKRRLEKDQAPSSLRELGELTCKDVWDAVKAGDAVAIEVAERFGYYLGKGLAAVACVTNPEAFVIGGGVSKAGEILFDYIVPTYQRLVFPGSRNARFLLAKLGNDAGIYGAAKLVLQ
ncbi:MAG: ROK family glucokinase [Lachnospiraceae bacterium]|nr:ROK family glucokinase [Lachnospiraceae bacterium]